MTRVAITGLGIVSPLGIGVRANTDALMQGRHGLRRLGLFDSMYKDELYVGEVPESDSQLRSRLDLPTDSQVSRTSLLAMVAARQCLKSMGSDINIDLISGSTVGGMPVTERFYDRRDSSDLIAAFARHNLGCHATEMQELLGLDGFATTISTACSSGANAIMMGARMIRSGRTRRVLVGGSDALCRFTINGFNSLKILTPELCLPFHENRKGLNLAEAAAYLLLEADPQPGRVLGYVAGWGNSNDAYHQTASSPQGTGAILAMRQALETAGINTAAIDYINAHGTATLNNDASETAAILSVFGAQPPPVSSTKSFTGHPLAAAGSMEAVFSLIALRKSFLPENLRFQEADQTREPLQSLPILTQNTQAQVSYVLSNSFGFGGNCTSLIFEKA